MLGRNWPVVGPGYQPLLEGAQRQQLLSWQKLSVVSQFAAAVKVQYPRRVLND